MTLTGHALVATFVVELPYSPGVLSRYWREAVEAAGCGTSTARGPTHLRDPDAPAGSAGGGDRGVDRASGREPDDAAVCSLAVCCTEGRRSEFGSSCDTAVTLRA